MELKDLYTFVLMLLITGMVIGIGVLITDTFGTSVALEERVVNESFTVPLLTDENVTLANGNLTGIEAVHNGTAANLDSSNYTFYSGSLGLLGILDNTTGCRSGATCQVIYTYTEYDNPTSDALGDARDAIGAIATSWFALIVTIVVLSIILVLVIRSFQPKR